MIIVPNLLKYNAQWHSDMSPLEIELQCIKWGGKWKSKSGNECGAGLFEHFMNARKLLWPNRYRHRWTELMYQNFIENDLTVLMGGASTQKTSHIVEYCLIRYWSQPFNTLVILSTVNMEKLEIGIWGECKMLWAEARQRHDWLAGNIIDHKKALATDSLEDGDVRDMRRGVISRPVYVGGRWVGLGILAGLKQENIIYAADEAQFMQESFSMSWPHLFSNGNVKIIASGNPKHDPDDELGKTAEPKSGWVGMPEPEKTAVWETKFMGGKCVNLVGTDSPNFDVPEGSPEPYPRLMGRKFAKRIEHDHGAGSFEYYRLVKGVMRVAFAHSRVITRQLCREHHAMEQVKWRDAKQTHIYALDPSYGGEDRCVGMPGKFGEGVDGRQILELMPYRVFKLDLRREMAVEDQIAEILAEELDTYDVTPENCFYDSTGKGTIGAAFARKFGHRVPVAVDSGAQPTKRPVREDLFVDEKGAKRLKRCDEHYSKFVTEMWFSLRYTIEAEQLRGLLDDVMNEGCARIYEMVKGNRYEIEAKSDPKKKEDLKRRLGKSPDLFDCFTGDTKILTPNGNVRLDSLIPGDEVITPFGVTNVAVIHISEVMELTDALFSNGHTLSGKGKHKVFVWGKGWVRLDALSIDNEIESSDNLPLWNILNILFTRDESSTFKALVDIIKTAGTMYRRDFYTDGCGLTTLGLFLKGLASIIKMVIGQITGSKIWNWFQGVNTRSTTWLRERSSLKDLQTKLLPSDAFLLPNGIVPLKVENGMYSTAGNAGKNERKSVESVMSAEILSTHSCTHRSSAAFHAETNLPEKQNGLKELVSCAVKCFGVFFTRPRRIVLRIAQRSLLHEKRKVYNLTLDKHNVYYANGILVDNCAVILTEGARQRGFKIRRLGSMRDPDNDAFQWLNDRVQKQEKLMQSKQLEYASS